MKNKQCYNYVAEMNKKESKQSFTLLEKGKLCSDDLQNAETINKLFVNKIASLQNRVNKSIMKDPLSKLKEANRSFKKICYLYHQS